jgi:hypothetical protein
MTALLVVGWILVVALAVALSIAVVRLRQLRERHGSLKQAFEALSAERNHLAVERELHLMPRIHSRRVS